MTLPTHLLDAIASAAVREGLADAVFTRLSTPIGRLLIVQGPHGVVRVGFEEDPEDVLLAGVAARLGPRIVASDRELAATRDAVEAYFAGDDESLAVPVDLQLVRSDFRRAALEALHDDVGPGHVVTYGGLAAKIGRPKAARAVGTACATNPVPLIVPCHRVVPGSGGVGSYGGGPDRKRRLLAHEGAILT
jgi:methylated-DNA-[protein]-cysteine S-methyltransferase